MYFISASGNSSIKNNYEKAQNESLKRMPYNIFSDNVIMRSLPGYWIHSSQDNINAFTTLQLEVCRQFFIQSIWEMLNVIYSDKTTFDPHDIEEILNQKFFNAKMEDFLNEKNIPTVTFKKNNIIVTEVRNMEKKSQG
jgi:hypothetical protein